MESDSCNPGGYRKYQDYQESLEAWHIIKSRNTGQAIINPFFYMRDRCQGPSINLLAHHKNGFNRVLLG